MDTNKKRKLRSGIIAALLMMLILLTGTYAWTQFNNVGFNAVDVGTNFGGRLHNNLEVREDSGIGIYNQNVFVENFGDNRIFVRVRLREFMSTTAQGIPLIEGTSINHPNGRGNRDGTPENERPWPAYQAQTNNVHERVGAETLAIGRNVDWTLGHTGGAMWYMPTFNQANIHTNDIGTVPALFNNPNAFQMIEASGDAVDAIASGFATTTPDAAREFREGVQTSPQRAGATPVYSDGTRDFWENATSVEMPVVYVNDEGELVQTAPVEHEARETNMPMTAPNGDPIVAPGIENGVMTFAQWHDAVEAGMSPTGNFWVMDAAEGWFYYATPLLGGEATSMLLSGIEVSDNNDEGIEYVIQVDAEFAIRSRVATDMFDVNNPVPDDVAMLWGEFGYEVEFERQDDEPMEMARATTATMESAGAITMSRVSLMGGASVEVPNPRVIWRVEGPVLGSSAPEGISVDPETGEVTVLNTAPGGEGVAYVVATAKAPSGGMGEARRRLDIPLLIPATIINTSGEIWTDSTDVDWCVLVAANSDIGGQGNILMITRETYGSSPHFIFNEFRLFEDSTLRENMMAWYDDANVSLELQARALNYTFYNVVNEPFLPDRASVGAGIEIDTDNGLEGPWLPHAQASIANFDRAATLPLNNEAGSGEVFALSATEVNRYLPHTTIVAANDVNDCRSRQAQHHDTGEYAQWLTRSMGGDFSWPARMITDTGGHSQASAVLLRSMRFAIWVRP